MRVFLDLDGVAADFDKLFMEMSGGISPPDYESTHGKREFWNLINADPNFFYNLRKMDGVDELVLGILTITGLLPIILTACPKTRKASVALQKIFWVRENIHPDVVCIPMHGMKGPYCEHPGDVLIDDFEKHRESWEERGGVFIHHKNPEQSLRELERVVGFQPIGAVV